MNSHRIKSRSHHSLFVAILSLSVCITGYTTMNGINDDSQDSAIGWDDLPGILERIVPPTFPDRDFDAAQKLYQKSLTIKEKLVNEHGAAITYGKLGLLE